ncbi:MAG: hypothetical protein ACHQ01_02285 [Candidatus Limnocylindrales bacterium]
MARRIRRASLALALVTAVAAVAAGCGSSSVATSGPGGSGCDYWCGNGSATVTIGSTTTSISGGGCYDGGSAGVDARFGDWGPTGIGDYLTLIAYRAGGPTPTPVATTTGPPAGPTPTGHPSPNVSGSVNGTPFVLGTDTVVSLGANGAGSFSGTDLNGIGRVKGTFTCS